MYLGSDIRKARICRVKSPREESCLAPLLSLRLGLGRHLQQVGDAGPTDRRSRQAHLGSSGSRGTCGRFLTPPPERRIYPAAPVPLAGLPDKSGVPSRHDKPRERGGSWKTQSSLPELSGYTGIPPGKSWPPPEAAILIMARSAQIRNPKSETRRKSEIRRPIPPAHPLTPRRRDSQRFAESSLSLRFSAFLCVSALSPVPESETRSPSLPLINTQLQLGEPRPRGGPTVSTVSPDKAKG